MLSSSGYEADSAATAIEARTKLVSDLFSIILIDVRMPGESGIELLRFVRTTYPDTAPIMVTGTDDQEIVEEAFEAGAYGYIIKPFRITDLLVNVTSALHRRALDAGKGVLVAGLKAQAEKKAQLLRDLIVPLSQAENPDEEVLQRRVRQ